MPRPTEPPVGAVLGDRYEVLRAIEWGGMDGVVEADDRLLRRRVALKVYAAATPEERAAFEEESRVLAERDDPRVYDTGPYGDDAFLVLELGDGGDPIEGDPTMAVAAMAPAAGGDPGGDPTVAMAAVGATAIQPATPSVRVDERRSAVPRRSRELPIWGAVIGLAAVLVAVLGFAATQRDDGSTPTPTAVVSTTATTARRASSTTASTEVSTTMSTTTTEPPTSSTTLPATSTTATPPTSPVTTTPVLGAP